MIRAQVRFRKSKYGVPRQAVLLAQLGQVLATRLEDRIRKRGVDGEGTRLPDLKKNGWFFADFNDPRWDDAGLLVRHTPQARASRRAARQQGGGMTPEQQAVQAQLDALAKTAGLILVEPDGYAAAKEKKNKKGVRDGWLTGEMWKSMTVVVEKTRKGDRIRLFFQGSSVTREIEVQVSSLKTRRTRKKVIRTRIANRDKARLMQYTKKTAKGAPVGAPAFLLMSISDAELREIVDALQAAGGWVDR